MTDALLPERHPDRELFISDVFDNLPVKSDMASMAHPVFSLSTKPVQRDLIYTNGDVSIEIKPTSAGLPTIFDKDVFLYCGSFLMREINEGRTPHKTLRVNIHDLLVATNRSIGGRGYAGIKAALDRLQGVVVKTNIKTGGEEQTEAFHLIEKYKILESDKVEGRMVGLEITVSDWFYNSVVAKEVLTISRNYFRLRKPLERRLYELARKHCGKSTEWAVGLEILRNKVGSTSNARKFRHNINKLVTSDHLPDYSVIMRSGDVVVFQNRKSSSGLKEPGAGSGGRISKETLHRAQALIDAAKTGWSLQQIRKQFTQYLVKKGEPNNINAAFIGFTKKKVKEPA